MYQSSEAFGNLVLQDSRTFKALITYDDVSITNAKSIKFTGGAEGEDDFSLGSTVSQYVTITIPDPGKAIEGHELLVQIGMEVNGLVEYIPMGYFTPGKPSRNEEQTQDAIEWCKKYGLIFDAVNDNLPEIVEAFGGNCRKIFANEYIDDRNRSIGSCRERSNLERWAENEVAIACRREKPETQRFCR